MLLDPMTAEVSRETCIFLWRTNRAGLISCTCLQIATFGFVFTICRTMYQVSFWKKLDSLADGWNCDGTDHNDLPWR